VAISSSANTASFGLARTGTDAEPSTHEQLRRELVHSGKFEIIDLAPTQAASISAGGSFKILVVCGGSPPMTARCSHLVAALAF
jgi:hypothetical protein